MDHCDSLKISSKSAQIYSAAQTCGNNETHTVILQLTAHNIFFTCSLGLLAHSLDTCCLGVWLILCHCFRHLFGYSPLGFFRQTPIANIT